MGFYKIKKGLDLPILGAPQQVIEDGPPVRHVALLGADYVGMKPTMSVDEGDVVRRGQLLFEDKKTAGVRYTAPAAGKVKAIHRGDRRAFVSLVIELDDAETSGSGEKAPAVSFESFTGKDVATLSREQVRDLLLESGLWVALRSRPFSRVADPAEVPHSIFVTAMDSNPLAAQADVVLRGKEADFERGVRALARLTEGKVYVCKRAGSSVPVPDGGRFEGAEFSGPHPAGNVGTHIHLLDPVSRQKTVWHLGYQDAVAIGRLFASGQLSSERVVALAGPQVQRPRLLRTLLGASTLELTAGELVAGENRIISGSVLSGSTAQDELVGYLGRYHQQVSVLREEREREFLGWMLPGAGKFSIIPAYLSRLFGGKRYAFGTSNQGSPRAMVPIGMYERVMPLDLMPTFLLRALYMGDMERSEELGCLELDEEDLALCTFVCPGKTEWGPYLRKVLTTMEKEG